ncbi:hypothetical protein CANTEDRAFT_101926 [Yamadazyma tenuis ATCC 10573]|nr:uncharacterized protein CANTEDRAFT_101926 [Yamadazyma tenuis ATCC 10573]EGV66211.1 hypothetical protein CANTEDRAFT_101926 [Yamadazyma tenuis ATCC 10573]
MAKDGSLIKLEYDDEFKSAFQRFFEDLFEMLDQCKPGIPSINNDDHYRIARDTDKYPNRDGRIPLYGGHLRENYLEEVVRTEQVLANYLRLDDNEINGLKGSHASFMKKMVKEFPPDLFKFGKYNEFMKGDGIVYLGGDDYNQLALLSIKMLRSTGSQLPVELIVPHESDYDVDLCNNILPALNGKCKVMSHYLPKELISNIQGYQYKNVALLISSFENVLYLDADNLPIQNPDSLFANEPFTNHHLVIWPDLWRRSTSPSFYTIADIQVNPKIRERSSYFNGDKRGENDPISFHDAMGAIPEASSETGQLLINKRVHFSTLVLSMYYNYYGPDYFYPLLSQGAAGEGDKETFIAAAHKLDLPYYQVKEFNREFGPLKNGKHEFFGMGQYDPLVDYIQDTNKDIALTTEFVPDYALNSDDKEHSNYDYHYFKSSSLMFLHANWPKYKLHEMFNHNSYGRGPTFDGKRRRLYEWNIIDETYGFDVELSIMSSLQWLYCEMNINLKKVPEVGSEDRTKICLEINSHISFMISVQ